MNRGFSLAEVIVVIAIFGIIAGIGSYVFVSARTSAGLNAATDNIVITLEKARTDAASGKSNSSAFSIKFTANSYTYFVGIGSSYSSTSPTNILRTLPGNYTLSNTYSSNAGIVTFSRLNGYPQASGTITITPVTNQTHPQIINIGIQGDITVIK